MLTYIIYFFVTVILLFVLSLAFKAINRGMQAKNNPEEKTDDQDNDKSNIVDEIDKLNKLKDKGLLNQEEFDKIKKRLLDK